MRKGIGKGTYVRVGVGDIMPEKGGNRRKKLLVKRTRKKRRILSKGGDDYQAFKLMRAEAAILRLQTGFNTHPRVFFSHILKVKYGMDVDYIKAVDAFRVLRDVTALNSDPNNSIDIAKNVYKAIRLDDSESLAWYLDQGFSTNYHNKFGDTILHFACKSLAVQCVHELIERKALVNVSNVSGRTPLHMAMWHHPEISLPVIRLICRKEPRMLVCLDWLNSSPLDNVCSKQWPVVCDFFNLSIDHYFEDIKPYLKRIGKGALDLKVLVTGSGDLDWDAIKSRDTFVNLDDLQPSLFKDDHENDEDTKVDTDIEVELKDKDKMKGTSCKDTTDSNWTSKGGNEQAASTSSHASTSSLSSEDGDSQPDAEVKGGEGKPQCESVKVSPPSSHGG